MRLVTRRISLRLKIELQKNDGRNPTAGNTMLAQGGGDVGLESFVIFIQFCAWDKDSL